MERKLLVKVILVSAASVLLTLLVVVGVAWAADIFTVDKDGTVRLVITDTGKVGIGTATPDTRLTIVGGGTAHIKSSDGTTDATTKRTGLSMPHYDNAEEDFVYMRAKSFSTTNDLYVGGLTGDSINAATRIMFYTADTNTTLGGTERMRITNAGNVGIGTSNPAASAKLEIGGTDGAILIPRLTTAERDALTAANGMIVYNTSTNAFNFRENGAWVTK